MRKYFLLFFFFIVFVWFVGPKPKDVEVLSAQLPSIPNSLTELDKSIRESEGARKIKLGCEAEIVWASDSLQQTEYAFVYLPGFTATKMEGDPIHRRLAKAFGANLFLARPESQGVDTVEPMLKYTVEQQWQSVCYALAVGKKLGKKVVLLSCSTGGSFGVLLSSLFPKDVYAHLSYSPNFEINNGAAFLLDGHWGLEIARLVQGGNYIHVEQRDSAAQRYWYTDYRIEGLVELQRLLDYGITPERLEDVHQPTCFLAYYKNEAEQDPIVRVSAMKTAFKYLGTPEYQKRFVELPNVGSHVMASQFRSKDLESVYSESLNFLRDVCKIPIR